MTYLTDYTHEAPSVDQLIAKQAMDHRRQSQSPTLKNVLSILSGRCPKCRSFLTDAGDCLFCKET